MSAPLMRDATFDDVARWLNSIIFKDVDKANPQEWFMQFSQYLLFLI
jgi:hypothetical protein